MVYDNTGSALGIGSRNEKSKPPNANKNIVNCEKMYSRLKGKIIS